MESALVSDGAAPRVIGVSFHIEHTEGGDAVVRVCHSATDGDVTLEEHVCLARAMVGVVAEEAGVSEGEMLRILAAALADE